MLCSRESLVYADFYDDGDDLDDFVLDEDEGRGRRSSVSDGREGGACSDSGGECCRWVRPGETVLVGSYGITGGFFYFGDSPRGHSCGGRAKDPSVVFSVLDCDEDPLEDPLHYRDTDWRTASYYRMRPGHRAAYLKWLAGGRDDPRVWTGHVFLYIRGIERRLLTDELQAMVSLPEFRSLIGELERLMSAYGHNRDLRNRLTDLLSYSLAANSLGENGYPDIKMIRENLHIPSAVRFSLAASAEKGDPLDAETALAWVKTRPDFRLRTPAKRCSEEFSALFAIRYRQKFGKGLRIKPGDSDLLLSYQTLNISLDPCPRTRYDLTDPWTLKAPFKKLAELADSCTDELAPLSRFLAGKNASRESARAFALLPRDLDALFPNPGVENLRSWVSDDLSRGSAVMIPVTFVFEDLGEEVPLKFGAKEAKLLSDALERAGFGVAPHAVFHREKPYAGGRIAVFDGGHGDGFIPSDAFERVRTLLDVAHMFTQMDYYVDSLGEHCLLKQMIYHDDVLTETEKRSLEAYLLWRMDHPTHIRQIVALLKPLSEKRKIAYGRFLVTLAAAEGCLIPDAIDQLEKLYRSAGVRGPEIMDAVRVVFPFSAEPPDTHSQALDHNLINAYEDETREIRTVLEKVFEDADETRDEAVAARAESAAPFSGLDQDHAFLCGKLVAGGALSAGEFRQMCDELRLMPEGAVEMINDWTFERVGAPLVRSEDSVLVDPEVAEEIKNIKGREL